MNTKQNTSSVSSFSKALDSVLHNRGMQLDSAQQHAVETLNAFYLNWTHYRKPLRLIRWIKTPAAPKGVYLWGGVGRGKSFLMDCFFDAIPETYKSRWHFHAFMRRIHSLLAEHKHQNDPLAYVAKKMARETQLLCFDEFHVSDIADAMILGRLFEHLIRHGVSMVITSNYPPEGLYPNGLQRQSFLPAINFLKQHLIITEVDGSIDYRHRTLSAATLFYAPSTPTTDSQLQESFQCLNGSLSWSTMPLAINNRLIEVIAYGEHVAWFDFHALCVTTRSQHDYLALAEQFDTLIISNIPQLKSDQSPEAIRFKWLIDILYDYRIKLMLSSDVPIQMLCPLNTPSSEFARTLSRLTEMQSDTYLHEAKRPMTSADQSHGEKGNITSSLEKLTLASA